MASKKVVDTVLASIITLHLVASYGCKRDEEHPRALFKGLEEQVQKTQIQSAETFSLYKIGNELFGDFRGTLYKVSLEANEGYNCPSVYFEGVNHKYGNMVGRAEIPRGTDFFSALNHNYKDISDILKNGAEGSYTFSHPGKSYSLKDTDNNALVPLHFPCQQCHINK